MSKTNPTKNEIKQLQALISPYIKPVRHHLGSDKTEVVRYDKRKEMYGGKGVVYLLQMFGDKELVNNRIGAYMILPTENDSCGFHTHGTRNEQELYVVISGKGKYFEKSTWESEETEIEINSGSITSVKGDAFHAVENCGNEPLIIFVITTNEDV